MENFSTLIENSKRAVRYWWLLLIIGIALFVVGILIFVYPTQSYLGMSLVFGWLMLFSGILEVVLSSANKHFITGRGWMLAGGIIEIILGIILIFNVALSAATLPIFLGFWLMLRGFSAIGLGGDMNATPSSETGKLLQKDWEILTITGFGTFPSDNPSKCIDYIMQLKGTPKCEVVGSQILRWFKSGDVTKASDHLPVMLDIKLPAKNK